MAPKPEISSRADAGGSSANLDSELIMSSLFHAYNAADTAGQPRPALSDMYAFLRNEQGFSKLTMSMLKAAEKAVMAREEERRVTLEQEAVEAARAEEISGEFDDHACAEKCRVHGSGMEEATVRQAAQFTIDAYDSRGQKKTTGGDCFFVAIRGPSRTRAKVTDLEDGTYHVDWKPSCSGTYSIAVSHFGLLLPGAPFTVSTSTSAPSVNNCVVRGEGLYQAVSRVTQTFEILFKDKHGAVARAVEIDLFVEPLPPSSPRSKRPPSEQEEANKEEEEKKAAEAAEKERRRKEKQEAKDAKAAKSRRGSVFGANAATEKAAAAAAAAQAQSAESAEHAGDEGSAHDGENFKAKEEVPPEEQVPTRHRSIRVRVGEKPLIVRTGFGKDSVELGRLLPGQVATVVEERLPDTGEVRACVALDSLTRAIDGLSFVGAVGEHTTSFSSANGSRPTTQKSPPRVRTPRRPGSTSPRRPNSPRRSSSSRGDSSARGSPIGSPLGGVGISRRSPGSGSSTQADSASRYRQSSNLSSEPSAAFALLNPFGYGAASARAELEKASATVEAERVAKIEADAAKVEAAVAAKVAEAAAKVEAAIARRAALTDSSIQRSPSAPGFELGAPPSMGRSNVGTPSIGSRSARRVSRESRETTASATSMGTPRGPVGSSKINAVGTSVSPGSMKSPAPAPAPTPSLPSQMGWVTLVKSGKKLVSSHIKLSPGSRRQYLGQWQRRKANDKTEQVSGHLAKTISHELSADPAGIGFAFGGVDPGVIHAHGQLHEAHKVSYSIGLSGHFLLHVRLRSTAASVQGSPFRLHVIPGPAHAKTSRISTAPLRGLVGQTPESGCTLSMHASDRMGNFCTAGGAKLMLLCDDEYVQTNVDDHEDGTYTLSWKSKLSGTFKTRITINGLDVIGSPRDFSLTSSTPDLSRSELNGEGLKNAVAGKTALCTIKFVDAFGNTAIPGEEFQFFMSIQKDKDKVQNVTPHEHQGKWEAGDTGIYEIHYTATVAGQCEMHVWCENPNIKAERLPLPGSPFHVSVTPGEPAHEVSLVDGWTKQHVEDKNDRSSGSGSSKADKSIDLATTLFASDTVVFRPQIFDNYSNSTTLSEGGLTIVQTLPDGTASELPLSQSTKLGQTTYEVRHTTSIAGQHSVSLVLFGHPIVGSPVAFAVLPDKPDPAFCKFTGPPEEVLYTEGHYACKMKTYDRFGNECLVGGLTVSARLQLQKQGVHDQTTLVPTNHSYDVKDLGNGEYLINLQVMIPCVFKVIVNMDKNLPSGGGELPPVTVHIVTDPNAAPKDEKQTAPSSGSTSAAEGQAKGRRKSIDKTSEKLKQAVQEVTAGFGAPEERREKDALFVAAEAFADGAATFDFDASKEEGGLRSSASRALRSAKEATSKPKVGDSSAIEEAATASTLSAAPISATASVQSVTSDVEALGGKSSTSPDNNLFDKPTAASPSSGGMQRLKTVGNKSSVLPPGMQGADLSTGTATSKAVPPTIGVPLTTMAE